MRKRFSGLLLAASIALVSIVMSLPALADSMLLIPGYRGSAASWRVSGVAYGLTKLGWLDGGHLAISPSGAPVPISNPAPNFMPGLISGPVARKAAPRRFFTMDMPTEAPLMVQSDFIARHIAMLKKLYPGERIILVGHSAGGVAARLAMARYPGLKVSALISIASPHLGTPMAELGSAIANSPLSWFAPFFGASTINRSRALYRDMEREKPGNILGWLNRAPHPPAIYVSVVRSRSRDARRGDQVAPGWRQDMNMVPALRGRCRTIFTFGDHGLRPADAILIAGIVKRIAASR
jgi:pimeloyl-ACP methyl ester carboxylesterase